MIAATMENPHRSRDEALRGEETLTSAAGILSWGVLGLRAARRNRTITERAAAWLEAMFGDGDIDSTSPILRTSLTWL